jgi:hypothetical protein
VVALSAGTLLTACGMPSANPVTYNAFQLTCCTKADIDQLWKPGTEVDLHWIVVTSTRTTVAPNHKLVIVGSLTGPYNDVATLKQGKGATHVVQGSVVTMDDRFPPLEPAVTTFVLPADLPAGYYNLSFKTDFGDGSSAGGASVVRVGTQ